MTPRSGDASIAGHVGNKALGRDRRQPPSPIPGGDRQRKAASADGLADLDARISADEELRFILGTDAHPLSQGGQSGEPDRELVQDLAEECRNSLYVWASGRPVGLAPLPPGQVRVPQRREGPTDTCPAGKAEWVTEVVPSANLHLSPATLGAFTRTFSSMITAMGRELGMTERQLAKAQAPLEKLMGTLLAEFDKRRAKRGRKELASDLSSTLRVRAPHLTKPQADLVAVRIAEIAGAEKPRNRTGAGEGDRLDRLGKRRRRKALKGTPGQKSLKKS